MRNEPSHRHFPRSGRPISRQGFGRPRVRMPGGVRRPSRWSRAESKGKPMRPFGVIAAWGLIAVTQLNAQSPPPAARPAFVAPSISPEDAKKLLDELEQEYESRLAKLPPAEGKVLYGRNAGAMEELIRERYEKHPEARRQLVA